MLFNVRLHNYWWEMPHDNASVIITVWSSENDVADHSTTHFVNFSSTLWQRPWQGVRTWLSIVIKNQTQSLHHAVMILHDVMLVTHTHTLTNDLILTKVQSIPHYYSKRLVKQLKARTVCAGKTCGPKSPSFSIQHTVGQDPSFRVSCEVAQICVSWHRLDPHSGWAWLGRLGKKNDSWRARQSVVRYTVIIWSSTRS